VYAVAATRVFLYCLGELFLEGIELYRFGESWQELGEDIEGNPLGGLSSIQASNCTHPFLCRWRIWISPAGVLKVGGGWRNLSTSRKFLR
jgi:hypothetical protein